MYGNGNSRLVSSMDEFQRVKQEWRTEWGPEGQLIFWDFTSEAEAREFLDEGGLATCLETSGRGSGNKRDADQSESRSSDGASGSSTDSSSTGSSTDTSSTSSSDNTGTSSSTNSSSSTGSSANSNTGTSRLTVASINTGTKILDSDSSSDDDSNSGTSDDDSSAYEPTKDEDADSSVRGATSFKELGGLQQWLYVNFACCSVNPDVRLEESVFSGSGNYDAMQCASFISNMTSFGGRCFFLKKIQDSKKLLESQFLSDLKPGYVFDVSTGGKGLCSDQKPNGLNEIRHVVTDLNFVARALFP